jgi:phosphoribosylformylglycinamidine synthase
MLLYFKAPQNKLYLVESKSVPGKEDVEKLIWLFNGAEPIVEPKIPGNFIGPRVEMITPWSTNAVEITQNMGIKGITRIEEFLKVEEKNAFFDPMLKTLYDGLDQDSLTIKHTPEPVQYI